MQLHSSPITQPNEKPYGYCQCGCGQKTRIASTTDNARGWIKGQPLRFVRGHNSKRCRDAGPNPGGLCLCGCGQRTEIARQTSRRRGWVNGTPISYIAGHNTRARESLEEYFMARVKRAAPYECWEWTGPKAHGYGRFKHQGKTYSAHRLAYELHYGPIPEAAHQHDYCVLHACDNPACCNPAHLRLGTHAANMEEMAKKGRHAPVSGIHSPNAKLTDEDVIAIRGLSSRGVPGIEIARRFGISATHVSSIIRRKSWSHVV